MTTGAKKRRLANELRIRVNPHYDHSVDPAENEFEFWNPVSATNDLIKVANATLEITAQISKDMAALLKVRTRKKQVDHELETMERELLVKEPPAASETKSTKLVAAAIHRRAESQGLLAKYQGFYDELKVLVTEELTLSNRIDRAELWLKTAERVSDNIKTALSFYKEERRHDYSVRG